MRTLFLNPVGSLGGAERCLLDLAASIREDYPGVALGLIASSDGPLLAGRAARAAAVERCSRTRLANELFDIYRATGSPIGYEKPLVRQA